MTPILTPHFELASAVCETEMKSLTRGMRQRLMNEASCPVPIWAPSEWPFNSVYNCYNFAKNDKSVPGAFPGMFADDPVKPSRYYFDTRSMHNDVHAGALKDGLIYLGTCFAHAVREQDVTPVALFMREPPYLDFHWMALRRHDNKMFWAHVPGMRASAMRLHGESSIFASASDRGYRHFGGYYGVPSAM